MEKRQMESENEESKFTNNYSQNIFLCATALGRVPIFRSKTFLDFLVDMDVEPL
jgi:hypothetical protein